MRKRAWGVSVCATLVVLGGVLLPAQISTSTILGVVRDASGAVVPEATVTIQSTETGLTRTVTTGEDGSYRVPALPVGNFTVRFEKSGFNTQTQQNVVLTVSQELVLNSVLQIATAAQEVTVTGEISLVNTTNSSLGALVNEQKIVELPLNGRNYNDLVFLQPGINRSTTQSSTSAPGGTIYSSNGATTRSNNYLLDGAPLQTLQGYSATSAGNSQLGVDGIREYKVVTNNYSAEYGMSMGSQMTMVSKGGTNQFHGTAFEYLRNAALDARNFFDYSEQFTGKRVPQYQRNNFGGAFGGPLRKNKLFFYGVYEGLREKKGTPSVATVLAAGCHGPAGTVLTNAACPQLQLPATTPSVTISQPTSGLLARLPAPNLPNNQFFWNFTNQTAVNYGQMRVDQVFSDKDTLFERYTTEEATLMKASGLGFYREPLESWNQWVSLSESHIFSAALLNTARFSYSRTNLFADSTGPNGEHSNPDGNASTFVPGTITGSTSAPGATVAVGASGLTPSRLKQNFYSLGDDLFYTKGDHALKIGLLVNRVEPWMGQQFWPRGNAQFGSIADYMSGILQRFQIETPGSDLQRFYRWYTLGTYLQDDWRVSSRLTLNLGLRYEFNTTPDELNGKQYQLRNPQTDTSMTRGPELRNASLKNFSPRLGFAWDVTGKGATSLRGGFGIYYDIAQIASGLSNQAIASPPLSSQIVLAGRFPLTVPFVPPPGAGGGSVNAFYYDSGQPKLYQWNVSVDQKLPFDMVLSLAYVGTRGLDLWVPEEGNPCIPNAIDSSGPLWSTLCGLGRVNQAFGTQGIVLDRTDSQSWYNALEVTVNKRLTKELQFQSSYTWAKLLDLGQGQINQDRTGVLSYSPNPMIDKGPSAFDLKQSWRFNALYHFPRLSSNGLLEKLVNGWWMGNIVSLQTGFPFSPAANGSRSQSLILGGDTTFPDRVNLGPTYNADKVILGNVNRWYDPTMFALQPLGRLGNAGRNILRGPGYFDWDVSFNKDMKIGLLGESGMLQFRAEFFNITNYANFSTPAGLNTGSTVFNSAGAIVPTAGQITSTVPGSTPRDIQFALKLIF